MQQDLNNRQKRLGQNKVKILLKSSKTQKYISLGQKNGPSNYQFFAQFIDLSEYFFGPAAVSPSLLPVGVPNWGAPGKFFAS